ncbi:putative shikimate 5-dehydrogenase [Fusarium tricinctum]|jgi:quinate dehydrogenase|uniref:Shikimate 5-dehydrogenase n=1 Tax=Fusarium tricinctum TaxID=61284 RepID=A0A8K0RM99_9HYPO|nr:putative shikimate 5-dehydrogenase [Fusarium tricinctum]
MQPASDQRLIYFVGTNLGHAVTNQIHDIIAQDLSLNWRLRAIDSPSLHEFLGCMRGHQFGGAVVTIPHKIAIMSHLDLVDDMGSLLGACNNVYRSPGGLLVGTNTDWIGVRDSLLQLIKQHSSSRKAEAVKDGATTPGKKNMPAFVVGAGGAARAAVYTLHSELGASMIYIINRDDLEVESLVKDITKGYKNASLVPPIMVHLRNLDQASCVEGAYYGVGTVPDFEPKTSQELAARDVLDKLLSKSQGVFLDMCYKPRVTRNIQLARQKGWTTEDGGQVVGWQLKAQWTLWAGRKTSEAIDLDRMIRTVHEIVETLP